MAPERGPSSWQDAAFATVDQDRSISVPAYEVAERKDVQAARPSMCVQLGGFTWRDPRLQDANGVVFEEEPMRLGGCCQRIE